MESVVKAQGRTRQLRRAWSVAPHRVQRRAQVARPLARRPGLGELSAEKEDQCRVIDPYQQRDQRPGRAVGRADARPADIGADHGLAHREQHGRNPPPSQHHASGAGHPGRI